MPPPSLPSPPGRADRRSPPAKTTPPSRRWPKDAGRPSRRAGDNRGSRDGKERARRAGKREQDDERAKEPWVEEDDAAKGSCGGVGDSDSDSTVVDVSSASGFVFGCLLLCVVIRNNNSSCVAHGLSLPPGSRPVLLASAEVPRGKLKMRSAATFVPLGREAHR